MASLKFEMPAGHKSPRPPPRSAQKDAKLFLTQREATREPSLIKLTTPTPPPEDDLDLLEAEQLPRTKLDIDDIKKRLYQRECTKLGVTPVGAFMREPTKSNLAIRHYSLGPRGAKALSVPLMLDSTLTSLDLEGNAIGPDGLAEMVEMLTDNCSITDLNLKRNKLGARGAKLMTRVLRANRHIVTLNLSANELSDTDGTKIADMLRETKTLKSLDLSDNSLASRAGEALGDALGYNESLETLDLSWNKFRGGGVASLLKGVRDSISLRSLSLAYNSCCRASIRDSPDILSPLLVGNETLHLLDLTGNRLTDQDFVMLAKGVKVNESLRRLKVGQNLISVIGSSLLLKSVLANETSQLRFLDMTDLPVTEEDLTDVDALKQRDCDVIHGPVLQKERPPDTKTKPQKEPPVLESNDVTAVQVISDNDVNGGVTAAEFIQSEELEAVSENPPVSHPGTSDVTEDVSDDVSNVQREKSVVFQETVDMEGVETLE